MIFGAIKLAGKVSTALWVVKKAHTVYKGYKKTAPAIKVTGKVFSTINDVKKKVFK